MNGMDELWELLDERTPYGTRPIAPTAPLAPFSQAAMDAADNLLSKAVNRIRAGEHDAANRLIERAADIPFDDHEETWPGINMAAVRVYVVLSDQAEMIGAFEAVNNAEDAPPLANAWDESPVDMALAIGEISGNLGPDEAEALRYGMNEVLIAGDHHLVDVGHEQRMLAAIDKLPRGEHDRYLPAAAPRQQRVDAIAAACRVCARLLDAFEKD